MMQSRSYRIAFAFAILMHLSLVIFLLSENTHERPVLKAEVRNEAGQSSPLPITPTPTEPIQAVSVDNQEIMKAVNQLKNERARAVQAEQSRQRALTQQMELARQQRVQEQRRLESLKRETAALAVAQKKKRLEEEEHLKSLAQKKIQEEKRLTEMKQEQALLQKKQQEQKKMAELEKKKADELEKKKADEWARANAARASQAKADLAKAQAVQKQQAAAQQAVLDAANAARVAGEVDKYKALIITAISQQWILPQNADSSMSSQFRIRLAPNGAVLEVSLTRSSGDAILDRSAQSAIYKASPLPVPNDPTTFNLFRDISLTVRPINARG